MLADYYKLEQSVKYSQKLNSHTPEFIRMGTFYTLDFSGDGINFSVIAAEIKRDMILSGKNKDATLFSIDNYSYILRMTITQKSIAGAL